MSSSNNPNGRLNCLMTGCNSRFTGNCGESIFAGAFHVGAPVGKLRAAFFCRDIFIVGHVVHFAAEGVERGHGVAFFARQQNKGEREVGRAFFGDGAAVLHQGCDVGGGWSADFSSSRAGGRPPVCASVGLSG